MLKMGVLSWFKCFLLLSVCCCFSDVETLEPISTSIAVGTALVSSFFLATRDTVTCKFSECCDDSWIVNNITGLRASLAERLHGQHLVHDVVLRSIRAHVKNPDPGKALVLSLHGWTGGGKNYVSNMVASNLYYKGINSRFVHQFVATLHFPHESRLETYKDQLHTWIKGNVSECGRQLFIFDELDKLPHGLMDAIKPFLDNHREINGVNYRKSIFLFLSNTAGNDISKRTLDQWRQGKERTHITLLEMEEIIQMAAYNEQGGLWQSLLLKHDLVSAFVPFLPLERKHIKLCIKDEFIRKNMTLTDENLSLVADELQYMPPQEKVFSKSGCKRVSQKVDQLIEED